MPFVRSCSPLTVGRAWGSALIFLTDEAIGDPAGPLVGSPVFLLPAALLKVIWIVEWLCRPIGFEEFH
jgi:hypothetical protein